MGAKFPKNESSRERRLARIFVPGRKKAGPYRSRERKFQGAKWPGSEWARERIGQGPNPNPFVRMFCFVTLYSEMFTIISTKGHQLDGFTYLVACHGYIFAMILYVFSYFCGK